MTLLSSAAPALCALQAVFVDTDGTVLYGSNCSIGLLTTDNTLVLPPDGDGLANFAVEELAEHTLEVRHMAVWHDSGLYSGTGALFGVCVSAGSSCWRDLGAGPGCFCG